jgi:hypothetical protein
VDFQIDCSCGQKVTVNEGAADGTANCACGQTIRVPSLKVLRVRVGLPAFHFPPEQMIEAILSSGEIPWGRSCVHCEAETDHVAHVLTECERSSTKEGGLSGTSLALGLLFSPFIYFLAAFFSRNSEERVLGKNKIYTLPLPICAKCRGDLKGQKAIKDCMQVIPAYRELLDKFPHAMVSVSDYGARTPMAAESPEPDLKNQPFLDNSAIAHRNSDS